MSGIKKQLAHLRKNWGSRRFRVGTLVLGAAGLFFGLVLFVLGESLGTKMTEYHVLFDESVKGMVVGSKVTFHGIPVGSVVDIRFQNGKSRVTVGVDRNKAPIQAITTAQMERLLITGQVSVELQGYKRDGKALEAGSVIPAQMSPFDALTRSLPDVMSNTDELVDELRQFVERLGDVLNTKNRGHVTKVLANLEAASGAIAKNLDVVMADAAKTLKELPPAVREATVAMRTMQSSVAKVGELAGSEDVRATMKSARDAMARLDTIERELHTLLAELSGLARGSRRQFLQTLMSARATLDELRQMARNLRIAPNSVIFGREKAEAAMPRPKPGGGR